MKPPLPWPPLLVAGLGQAGEAALAAIVSVHGPAGNFGWDGSTAPAMARKAAAWRARGVEILLGGDGRALIKRLEAGATIVKSPGIDLDAAMLSEARSADIACIDELEYGWRKTSRPIAAVTGTNGKSTTCALVGAVLRAAGKTCQIVGNSEFGPPLSAAATDIDQLVCEVSSFQLEASPTFLPDVAIFTNLTPEHLTRHLTMKRYGAIKSGMFVREPQTAALSIINSDDAFGAALSTRVKSAGGRVVTFGFGRATDVQVMEAAWTATSGRTSLRWQGRTFNLTTTLPGRHNAYNIAAAFAFGVTQGIEPALIANALARAVAPPGRWQVIAGTAPFDVIVDYAHTPDGLVQVLSAARTIAHARKGRVHSVFGPVGLPDPEKAAGCAAAIAAHSDRIVLTTGSAPRSSRIMRIKELRDAIGSQAPVEIVLARQKAIGQAISTARTGDIVLVLGIGALGRLIVDANGTVEPCDDRATAARWLERVQR